MVRLSRAIAVLLLTALIPVLLGSTPAERIVVPDTAALTLRQGASGHTERTEAPATTAMVAIDTEDYRVVYPLAYTRALPPLVLIERIEAAKSRVEGLLGPFEGRLEIMVPGQIIPDDPEFPKDLRIAGACFTDDDGQIWVVVALWAAKDSETFAHELLHARLRDLGATPPRWFEEGMAHFAEHEDGFNPALFELLEDKGPLSMDEIKRIDGVTEDEMRLRATAWAIVYYLMEVEGHEFSCMAYYGVDDLPDPLKVFEAIQKHKKKTTESKDSDGLFACAA